jgi:hypothetical protein
LKNIYCGRTSIDVRTEINEWEDIMVI